MENIQFPHEKTWRKMYQYRQMAVPDFMNREAPANYVAGLGRGATGFVTRSDLGGGFDDTPAIKDDERFQDPDNESGLFSKLPYDAEDLEADRIYEQVEKNMQERRRKWREKREQEELEKVRKERPTFQQQFAELKRGLANVTPDEWANLPEVQDMVRKRGQKKEKEEVYSRFNAVPDSVLLTNATQGQLDSSIDLSEAGKTDFVQFSQARDRLLGIKLDQISDSVSGQAAVDTNNYLSDLSSVEQKSTTEIADIKKARMLLKSVISTNPKHAPGWIAAARLEEVAGKMAAARDIINKGCENCPKSEDVWLDAARLNKPDQAKIILAKAIKHVPQSVKIWLKAKELEQDVAAQKRVLRKALEHIPTSAKLWKVAIAAEEDPEDARILLGRAVECVPDAIELWLALARMDDDLKNAQAILNKALKMNPTSHEIWLAAAKLQEQHKLDEKVNGIIFNAVKKLLSVGVHLERKQWIQLAETCEREGFLTVCRAVIENTIGLELEEEEMKPTWFSDADECVKRNSVHTARFIFGHAIKTFPQKKSIWRRAAFFERDHGTKEQLFDILERALDENPHNEVLWLVWAKELWIMGDINAAKSVLQRAFESNEDSEQIWLAAIKLEMETQNFATARELLQKARNQADTARVWMKSVVVERILKNYDKALQMITEAIAKFANSEKLWIIKGQILQYDLNDPEKARVHYQQAVKKLPKSAVLWILSSKLEEQQGLSGKARAILERSRVINPKNDSLWLEAVLVEKRGGNGSMVKALLSKAIQECPNSGLLWCELILNEVRPQRKARSMDALKKCDNDPYVLCTIARLFWQERKLDKARGWFERAVKANGDLGDAWAWWYRFECEHGTEEQRQQIMENCKKQDPRHGVLWCSVSKDLSNFGKNAIEVLQIVSSQLSPTLA
jgi:pre-mRNA-processing factor 6